MNDFSRQAGESGAHSQMRKKSVLELRDVSIYYNEVRAVKMYLSIFEETGLRR